MTKYSLAFLGVFALAACSGGELLGINSHPSAAPVNNSKPEVSASPSPAATTTASPEPSMAPSVTPSVTPSASPVPSASSSSSSSANTIAQLTVSYAGPTPIAGSTSNYSITITAMNSSGQVITGNYTNPITLTSSDTNDLLFYDAQSNPTGSILISGPGMNPMMFYDGTALPPNTQILVYAQGVNTASTSF